MHKLLCMNTYLHVGTLLTNEHVPAFRQWLAGHSPHKDSSALYVLQSFLPSHRVEFLTHGCSIMKKSPQQMKPESHGVLSVPAKTNTTCNFNLISYKVYIVYCCYHQSQVLVALITILYNYVKFFQTQYFPLLNYDHFSIFPFELLIFPLSSLSLSSISPLQFAIFPPFLPLLYLTVQNGKSLHTYIHTHIQPTVHYLDSPSHHCGWDSLQLHHRDTSRVYKCDPSPDMRTECPGMRRGSRWWLWWWQQCLWWWWRGGSLSSYMCCLFARV